MSDKIGRDAFLFLKPKHLAEDFAQCGPCRMYVPPDRLDGKMKGRCILHGSKIDIDEDDSCGFMAPWPTPDGKPNSKVVGDHAAELLKNIPGSVTPEDSGLVSRRVQCHRCTYADAAVAVCSLYRQMNKLMPNDFALDTKIERHSCCNAQTPKSSVRGSIALAMKK